MTGASQRTYAGASRADRVLDRRRRLLEAGLEKLGSVGARAMTVRSVIEQSGLAPRYFYESFASLDELQVAVFEQVVAEVEATAVSALVAAPRGARAAIQAVIAAVVELLLDDPRKGRVALVESLSAPALGALRARENHRFARLLATYTQGTWRDLTPDHHAVSVTTLFATGGFGETLTSVLMGHLTVERDQLVDDLTELFLGSRGAIRAMAQRA